MQANPLGPMHYCPLAFQGFLGFCQKHFQAQVSSVQTKCCRSSSAPSILLALSLAAQWGPNHALTSLHSSPSCASARTSHRHSFTTADAQLTLPPAGHHHPASLCHLPAAQPPATHAGGQAPHPPHLCGRCHHTAQRQRSPPQRRGRRRTPGWPC